MEHPLSTLADVAAQGTIVQERGSIVQERGTIDLTMPATVWERSARESDLDWALFRVFRDSAYPEGYAGRYRPRSQRAIAEQAGYSVGRVSQIATSHRWFERCAAYDRHVDQTRNAVREGEAEETNRALDRCLRMAVQLIELNFAKLLTAASDPESPPEAVQHLTTLLRESIKAHRLMQGQSTENVAVKSDVDLSKLPDDVLLSLRESLETDV